MDHQQAFIDKTEAALNDLEESLRHQEALKAQLATLKESITDRAKELAENRALMTVAHTKRLQDVLEQVYE